MALQAIVDRERVYRVVLEEYAEGVYVLVFDTASAEWPCEDHLQNDWPMARRAALHDYGITDDQWREVPDTKFNG
ncbi:MAG: hypothetical protein JNL96_16245 [Planctomycetaceae bacterium]|nr:hypothetical protein [Planctomycetaceae bacterium]